MYRAVREFPWYLACRDGYLINADTGNVLRGCVKRNGYVEVCLLDGDGLPKSRLLHRIIAEAFCDKGSGEGEVNHINGDKTDNRADNLEWTTRNENLLHAYETGLRKNDVSARSVVATSMESGECLEFHSIYSAARFLGISQGNICMCCKGERPHAGGYYWHYSESGNQNKLNGGE